MPQQNNYNFRLKCIILLIVLSFCISAVSAHQPRIELGLNNTITDPVQIQNIGLGQAFYGNLKGHPDYYQINSNRSFELIISSLVPASPGLGGSFPSITVKDSNGKNVITIDGDNSTWTPFVGEFHDYYLEGPEVTRDLPSGTYNIEVYNANNKGKYLMIIGNETILSADDYLQDFANAPILKEQFFGKPITQLFIEIVGVNLALGIVMVLFIMLLISRRSIEFVEIAAKSGNVLKPWMCLGITVTVLGWIYVIYRNSFNILSISTTVLLGVVILLSMLVISKISRMRAGRLTFLAIITSILLWWLFIYWALIII
jgi:hypothetical protein